MTGETAEQRPSSDSEERGRERERDRAIRSIFMMLYVRVAAPNGRSLENPLELQAEFCTAAPPFAAGSDRLLLASTRVLVLEY